MNVEIARTAETLKVNKQQIPTERFDFSGDWQASVWLDQNKTLVQLRYLVDKHEVRILLDE
ncbi:MAG: hypothetical protein ACREH6_10420 [Geminicoccaceae bacterium]